MNKAEFPAEYREMLSVKEFLLQHIVFYVIIYKTHAILYFKPFIFQFQQFCFNMF